MGASEESCQVGGSGNQPLEIKDEAECAYFMGMQVRRNTSYGARLLFHRRQKAMSGVRNLLVNLGTLL